MRSASYRESALNAFLFHSKPNGGINDGLPAPAVICLMQFLNPKPADPNIRNNNNKTALELAQEQGHSDIVKLLQDCEIKED